MSNKNVGWRILNLSKAQQDERNFTVIVSGVARSGTTMVSRILSAGGLSMGAGPENAVQEDLNIASAIETGDIPRIRRLVKIRNAERPRWGFKRPLIVQHDALIGQELRNPRYVLIFRDPLAVAMRNGLSLGFPLPAALGLFNQHFADVAEFVKRSQAPMLLASYEKALQDPHAFVEALIPFCGLAPEHRAAMIAAIRPNDETYLEATRPR